MSDQPRPVWLTREQRDAIGMMLNAAVQYGMELGVDDVAWDALNQWDAAPADARAEIIKALATGRTIDHHIWTRGDAADGVLRALGVPDA